MTVNAKEIEKRTKIALSAIKAAYGTSGDEFGTTLFVSHHLEELDDAYWERHLQRASPEPIHVLSILTLKSHWGDEDDDEIDTFDFTLPGEVTDYVISVQFDDNGTVEGITMES